MPIPGGADQTARAVRQSSVRAATGRNDLAAPLVGILPFDQDQPSLIHAGGSSSPGERTLIIRTIPLPAALRSANAAASRPLLAIGRVQTAPKTHPA